jgi:hypothetical protein
MTEPNSLLISIVRSDRLTYSNETVTLQTISTYSHIPHKTIKERKSAELNLVTAHSTAYAPPEDGRISGPKHVVVTFTKMFFNSFFVF